MPHPEPATPDPDVEPPRTGPSAALAGTVRWSVLGAASGVLAGLASAAFLEALDAATRARLAHGWLVWLLPVAGLAIGGAYHAFGGRAGAGNALLLDEIHQPTAWVPRRMAPLVGVGTVVSHLFGASVGREGTALQMSGSLTDWLARAVGLTPGSRRLLLVASLGAGFGGVFGVPWAGAVFGIEVQAVRRIRYRAVGDRLRRLVGRAPRTGADGPVAAAGAGTTAGPATAAVGPGRWIGAVVPTLVASFVADAVVRAVTDHQHRPQLDAAVNPTLLGRVAVVGVACGLAALVFVEAVDVVRRLVRRTVRRDFLRPALGGVVVVAAAAVVGRDHLGLSLPLIDQALAGDESSPWVPVLKVAFTAVCLGSGFVGGEVTPLFVVGATTGAAVAPLVGLDPAVAAAVGFVATFGGAANTPLACGVMGVELFGTGTAAVMAVGCGLAYLCSGHRGIYATQRVATADGHRPVADLPGLADRVRRRR